MLYYIAKEIKSTNTIVNRNLQEDEPGLVGHVVMGKSEGSEIFVATNASNFPQGTLNGTLTIAITQFAEECNTEAYGKALPFQFEDPVAYAINELGMIESENGWHAQSIRELEGNSTLPISLVDHMRGAAELFVIEKLGYGLAVYVLGAEEELLGCASMKKVDDEEAVAEYNDLLNGLYQEEAVMDVPSSARQNGLFVFVSAVAAIGIAVVLGDVLAL